MEVCYIKVSNVHVYNLLLLLTVNTQIGSSKGI